MSEKYDKRPQPLRAPAPSRKQAELAKRQQLLRECPDLSRPIDGELKGRISVQRWSYPKS